MESSKDELDLNQRQIRAALGILGENDIPPERLAAKLVEIAERFTDLHATASAQPGDDPKIAALKADAQKAIEAGELAKADALLADVETSRGVPRPRAVNAAETSARRGEIALTRLRYAEAAKHFANAAAVRFRQRAHTRTSGETISHEKRPHCTCQGYEFGDNDALRSAIERAEDLLAYTRASGCRSNGPMRRTIWVLCGLWGTRE